MTTDGFQFGWRDTTPANRQPNTEHDETRVARSSCPTLFATMTMMWTPRTIVSGSRPLTALKRLSTSSSHLRLTPANLHCVSCISSSNSSPLFSRPSSEPRRFSSPFTNEVAFFSSDSNNTCDIGEKDGKETECSDQDHVPGKTSDEHGTSITIPGTQKGGRKLAIVFTCTVCETRSAKQFSEQAYLNGVVIVRCPGCQNLHLIADRLGYFEDGDWDLDSIVAKTGQSVKTINESSVLEVTLEDLVGKEGMREILKESESLSSSADQSK